MPNKPKPTATAGGAPADPDNGNAGEGQPAPTPAPTPPTPTPTPPGSPTPTPAPTPAPAPPTSPPAAATDYDKGVQAERERVSALQKLDKPATHDIVTKAIAEGKTVGDIAADCVEAIAKAGTQSARRADASALTGIPGSDAGTGNGENTFGSKLKSAVAARMKARNRSVRVNSRN